MNIHSDMLLIALLCIIPVMASSSFAQPKTPSEEARNVAQEIRNEALMSPNGAQGRPLPLVSHWNMGSYGKGWTPDYQIELLNKGHHILPWMSWPQGNPDASEEAKNKFLDYYGKLIHYCRELELPVSFRGTQWEAMLVKKEYRELPTAECPAVVTPNGEVIPKLSPFGPVDKWRDPAGKHINTPAMKKIQEMYPDPPLILFVSNNEAPDLRWHQVHTSKRYLDRYGSHCSDEFKRKVVSEGWMERYPVMFKAMRDALTNDTWKGNVRFVGYGSFGPSHFGRWAGWKEYSLITNEWIDPEPLIWDGGSPSYYTHNWNDNRDHWVWSTQVQSMNWIFMLDWIYKEKPDFWWEVSLWDGNNDWTPDQGYDPELLKKSKACQYMKDGQTYTPDRYEGWAQFGLWLLRPRVMREFRGSTVPIEPWRPYFERLLSIVDRVYDNEILREFWRYGELVPNNSHQHPYQEAIPEKYKDIHRWYLLDTSLDPSWPWNSRTNIPVFSMALVQGAKGSRRWLLYAHAPLKNQEDVEIVIPDYGEVTGNITRSGVFYLIEERTRIVKQIALE